MTDAPIQNARLRDISLILKDFLKVIKVVSMYPADNPLPQSMKRSLAERLVWLVEQYGTIGVTVGKDDLSVDKEVVYQDRSKEEGLAAVFFETGITQFGFESGLTVEGVYKLLDIIKEYINAPHGSQDLASRIWESAIAGFSLTTLQDMALLEYDSNFDIHAYVDAHADSENSYTQFGTDTDGRYQSLFGAPDGQTRSPRGDGVEESRNNQSDTDRSQRASFFTLTDSPQQRTILDDEAVDSESLRTAAAARAMGLDDVPVSRPSLPDTTFILNEEFKLSEEEETSVLDIVRQDAEFDAWDSTLDLIKELLHQESDMDGFYETVTICERMITEFLVEGKVSWAARMLEFLKQVEESIGKDKPLWAERIKDAHLTAGSRDRLKALTQGLNDHPDIGTIEINQYLSNFGWESLSGIAELLGDFTHDHHREALCDYLAVRGKRQPEILARGIYDKRWQVAHCSALILARVGDDRCLRYLRDALTHREARVRLDVITVMQDCEHPDALKILREGVLDENREVAKTALVAILVRKGQAAFETVASIMNDQRFAALDREEQTVLLRAFSILGGDVAVDYLSRLILRFNPLRNRALAFFRRAAFDALSYNTGDKGQKLLVKLTSSWRRDIRRQATAALRRHRETLFQGKQ